MKTFLAFVTGLFIGAIGIISVISSITERNGTEREYVHSIWPNAVKNN